MATDDLIHAPPATPVDGLMAVPIDIDRVHATLVFDAAAKVATLEAEMRFALGPTAGNPLFDFRQPISDASLNGAPLAPAELAHHDLGGGPGAELRVIERTLAAGSTNTLVLRSTLGTPQSQGANPIGFEPASTRLYFDFWFSDLFPGRYLEMWLPANLIYDRFALDLTVRIDNSGFQHLLFANGAISALGANQWRIQYPDSFTALSPMLVIAAADRLTTRQGSVNLPGSGPVALDLFKLTTTPADLATVETSLAGYLAANVASSGPYAHGARFTAFIWSGTSRSMEYEGATTSTVGALQHEVFHSWWARGVKPATQNDSWLDEGWTVYNTDAGAFAIEPFDVNDPPVTLAGRNPFNRVTPGTAYSAGRRFFAGLAAELGLAQLRALMKEFYTEHAGELVTTADLEAHLVSRSGRLALADWFHRFVYGLPAPRAGLEPDLYIRDSPGDPGVDHHTGPTFWDSPDLWIRNQDDPVTATAHQSPEAGQDNYFYARVRNRGAGTAGHFVATFNVKPWAGTEFLYPGDFLPAIAGAVGFDLPVGGTTVLKARWPEAQVPALGTHACWLASVYTPGDPVAAGAHVWEHNNLAQKNLTVVELVAGDSVTIPLQLGNLGRAQSERFRIELRRPRAWQTLAVALELHEPLDRPIESMPPPLGPPPESLVRVLEPARVELSAPRAEGRPLRLWLGRDSALALGAPIGEGGREPEDDSEPAAGVGGRVLRFRPGTRASLPLTLRGRLPLSADLRVTAPPAAKPGNLITCHVLQRHGDRTVVGGVAVRIAVRDRLDEETPAIATHESGSRARSRAI
jgi:hypothetical protein